MDRKAGFALTKLCACSRLSRCWPLWFYLRFRDPPRSLVSPAMPWMSRVCKGDRNAAIRNHKWFQRFLMRTARGAVRLPAAVISIPADVHSMPCSLSIAPIELSGRRSISFPAAALWRRDRHFVAGRRLSDTVNWLTGGVEVVAIGEA